MLWPAIRALSHGELTPDQLRWLLGRFQLDEAEPLMSERARSAATAMVEATNAAALAAEGFRGTPSERAPRGVWARAAESGPPAAAWPPGSARPGDGSLRLNAESRHSSGSESAGRRRRPMQRTLSFSGR
jgi:hypothetical protein